MASNIYWGLVTLSYEAWFSFFLGRLDSKKIGSQTKDDLQKCAVISSLGHDYKLASFPLAVTSIHLAVWRGPWELRWDLTLIDLIISWTGLSTMIWMGLPTIIREGLTTNALHLINYQECLVAIGDVIEFIRTVALNTWVFSLLLSE